MSTRRILCSGKKEKRTKEQRARHTGPGRGRPAQVEAAVHRKPWALCCAQGEACPAATTQQSSGCTWQAARGGVFSKWRLRAHVDFRIITPVCGQRTEGERPVPKLCSNSLKKQTTTTKTPQVVNKHEKVCNLIHNQRAIKQWIKCKD